MPSLEKGQEYRTVWRRCQASGGAGVATPLLAVRQQFGLDGSTKPCLCTNANHGCAYRDEDGQWRGSYLIFATREMLKGLYAVTHLNKPQCIVDVHESFCLCIPTTSFCDVIDTGEHEPFSPERIDEIRVRYGRRAWGIPVEVLGSMPNHVRFAQRYSAYMLIHDARVRPAGAQTRNDKPRVEMVD